MDHAVRERIADGECLIGSLSLKGYKMDQMNNQVIPALIVFGILLAISLYGLLRSNAAAERLNGPSDRRDSDMTGRAGLAPSSALGRT